MARYRGVGWSSRKECRRVTVGGRHGGFFESYDHACAAADAMRAGTPGGATPARVEDRQSRDEMDLLREIIRVTLPSGRTWSADDRNRWLMMFVYLLDYVCPVMVEELEELGEKAHGN